MKFYWNDIISDGETVWVMFGFAFGQPETGEYSFFGYSKAMKIRHDKV